MQNSKSCSYGDEVPSWQAQWWQGGMAGGVTKGNVPLVCSDYWGQCYKRSTDTWSVVRRIEGLTELKTMASIAVGEWVFFAGGSELPNGHNSPSFRKSTFFLNKVSSKVASPDLGTAKSAACAAVLVNAGTRRVIAVLGGLSSGEVANSGMELFDCTAQSGVNPSCTGPINGPSLKIGRAAFGCGVIKAGDGKTVFLATKSSAYNAPTEILDVTSPTIANWGSWQTIANDVPEFVGEAQQSFLTSKDEKKGIWLLSGKDYFYEVSCTSVSSCSFARRQLNPAYTYPAGAAPLLITENVKCPA